MVHGNVDESSADKDDCEAYIHENHVVDGAPLAPGDLVSFNLYRDDQGLRAEDCQVLQKAAAACNAAEDVAFDVECRRCVIGCADVFSRLSSAFSSIDGDGDHTEGDHSVLNVAPVSLLPDSTGGPTATDVDRIADVFTRLSNAFSVEGQDQDESDRVPKCTPSDTSTSEGSASDVEGVAGVFIHLSKAFSADGADDSGDELDLDGPCNTEYQEQMKSDIVGMAGVFMRLSRVFSSEDGDDSDADDEFDLGSPWKAAATTELEGSALEDADMDVECVADVFVRLSSAFSSCDEDDCDAEDGTTPLTLNSPKTIVMGETKAAPEVNGSTPVNSKCSSDSDHVAGVFMHLSKAFSLHDADDSDADDELDMGGPWKAGTTQAVTCSSSERSTRGIDRIANVFMCLSKAIDSDDDGEAENEFDSCNPRKTKSRHSDIDDVSHMVMRLSRTFSLHDEDNADADDEFDIVGPWKGVSAAEAGVLAPDETRSDVDHVAGVFMCLHNAFSSDEEGENEKESNLVNAWKAKRTSSSDGSTCGGATSDSEQDISFYEASDSETETYSEGLAR